MQQQVGKDRGDWHCRQKQVLASEAVPRQDRDQHREDEQDRLDNPERSGERVQAEGGDRDSASDGVQHHARVLANRRHCLVLQVRVVGR